MDDRARREYLTRVHRAQDFIETHVTEPLTLEEVARAAGFSPFHFHRIFSAVTGETLYQFILRLRLERAAGQLVRSPDKPVTAVALDCGFSSSATFARAFRAGYGMSARAWRERGAEAALDRKKRKTVGKDRKDEAAAPGYLGGVDTGPSSVGSAIAETTARRTPMTVKPQQITVENMEGFPVAYVRHVGPYAGDAQLFERLFGQLFAWAGPRGFLGPSAKILVIYHDNPDITDEDKLRTSVCVSIPPGTPASGEVGVMEIPAGPCARARFELAPTEFGEAWEWLMGEWFPTSGYQPDDRPCYELCLNDPRQHPEGKHIVELTMPVRPL